MEIKLNTYMDRVLYLLDRNVIDYPTARELIWASDFCFMDYWNTCVWNPDNWTEDDASNTPEKLIHEVKVTT